MAAEEEEALLPPGEGRRGPPWPLPHFSPPPTAEPPPYPPSAAWRNGAAFWLLGLCNNLPYVLMLSAARDIVELQQGAPAPPGNGSRYDCNQLSTGAVLLADVLPALLIKLLAPLAPHWLSCEARVGAAALCAWGGAALLLRAEGPRRGLAGVSLASAASGLGEVTLLTLAPAYPIGGLSGWASGTGAAGLWGALWGGAGLGAGLRLSRALLPAAALPMGTALSFFFLLLPPPPPPPSDPSPPDAAAGVTWGQRWGVVKGALPDALPLAVVYFGEYFINQGVLDLLYFPTSSLTHNEQYRWAQLLYQVGVFLSRSGFRLLRLRHIWGLMGLQVLNAALLLAAALTPFLPAVGVAFALVLWEGLVGGAAYGSAYAHVGQRAPPGGRGLAVAVTSLGQSLGVALAGVAAMGLHRAVCAP
ncbi:battenin [Guaruba guarouba]